MHDIFAWLNTPPLLNAIDELTHLSTNLTSLRESKVTPKQHASALGRLFTRSISITKTLLPSLSSVSLPISRKNRQLIRHLQDLLQALANDLLSPQPNFAEKPIDDSHQIQCIALWRGLLVLEQHLLISNLTAAPSGTGTWLQLHQTYEKSRQLNFTNNTPEGTSRSLQQIYYSAILLGCAQPASFTSHEVDFVMAYLERFVDRIVLIDATAADTPAAFWIDPAQDAPAVACNRKPAPPETMVSYFSCTQLATLLKEQLSSIETGKTPKQINLPDFSSTIAGRGVLRRLISNWGEPGKRRFTRRRQNNRAVLCTGLNSLWRLFQDKMATTIETSSWMITNQSPDGYAVMHLTGKTGGMSVGDISAIRTELGEDWQICIVRWALSDNQEHLEFGLQILATHAVPAFLAQPNQNNEARNHGHLSVLILPEIPPLRSTEMLVVPSGALEDQSRNLVLIVEKENIEIREVISTYLEEQNSRIEVFSIESDAEPSEILKQS